MSQRIGTIIVLNGASSAGKTSVAQALLPLLGIDSVYTGFDDILSRVQPFGSTRGGVLTTIQRRLRIVWFQQTDGRLRLFQQLHREVVAHARAGRNTIVETALMDRRALADAAMCFAPLGGLFVGMKPPLEVSQQWEAKREDRPQGQARKHYDRIHAHGVYDLVLDPSILTPEACAAAILQRIAEEPMPNAFQRLVE